MSRATHIVSSIILFFSINLCAISYSIIFVHIGKTIPSHVPIATKQARLFNTKATIILIANKTALQKAKGAFESDNITLIPCESLQRSPEHTHFLKHFQLDKKFRKGFWQYTSERFYYLYEFISQHNTQHVFHLEHDNMLYANLEELLPIFTHYYHNKIGAVFDNDNRCIPSFLYISNADILQQLIIFMTKHTNKQYNDMHMLGFFKKHHPEFMVNLPLIPLSYTEDHPLISICNHKADNPSDYCHYIKEFNGIFDGAALGQYLGGIDPKNGVSKPGFTNESCIFNPSHFSVVWQQDAYNRKIPYINYKSEQYRIFNLHIHSKKLHKFTSYK